MAVGDPAAAKGGTDAADERLDVPAHLPLEVAEEGLELTNEDADPVEAGLSEQAEPGCGEGGWSEARTILTISPHSGLGGSSGAGGLGTSLLASRFQAALDLEEAGAEPVALVGWLALLSLAGGQLLALRALKGDWISSTKPPPPPPPLDFFLALGSGDFLETITPFSLPISLRSGACPAQQQWFRCWAGADLTRYLRVSRVQNSSEEVGDSGVGGGVQNGSSN